MYNKLYSQIADALVSDGYIIIPNAINKTFPHAMNIFIEDDSGFKKAEISSASKTHENILIRSDKTKWLTEDGAIQSKYLAFAEGLRVFLNRSLYLGLSYYESHFAIYQKGDFYVKHLDAFVGSKNRVVTTVYYLNENYKDEDGGALVLYDKEDKELLVVLPHADTLVVFLSEKFTHEVKLSNTIRHSIAGWFRVDKR